mgnify:CR=1 FL=1
MVESCMFISLSVFRRRTTTKNERTLSKAFNSKASEGVLFFPKLSIIR